MLTFAIVIRLRRSGLMAQFDESGRLVEWTADILKASHFATEEAAVTATRAICAPEIRAAIREGRAVRVVDEETGEAFIVDAHDPYELFPTPRIRLDACARYLSDDPSTAVYDVERDARRRRARELVQLLFAEAPRLNWPLATKPRLSPANAIGDEYRTPASARAQRAGALARYRRPTRVPDARATA